MDILFEWTETRHSNILQFPLVVSSEQCIQYMHEARLDVLYVQLYWMVLGVSIISLLYLLSVGNKLSELERKLDIYEEAREINYNHVKLV